MISVWDISFDTLEGPQEYLCNSLFTNRLRSLLFNLRCRSMRNIRDNYYRQFQGNLSCPFLCPGEIDSQKNLLVCVAINKYLKKNKYNCWRRLNTKTYLEVSQSNTMLEDYWILFERYNTCSWKRTRGRPTIVK